jgi:hypothetical protein
VACQAKTKNAAPTARKIVPKSIPSRVCPCMSKYLPKIIGAAVIQNAPPTAHTYRGHVIHDEVVDGRTSRARTRRSAD